MLSASDSSRLIDHLLTPQLPQGIAESGDIKLMANNIMITPRPASKSILDKVGGFGKTMKWQVTGIALLENRLWAARVAPVSATEKFYSENPVPVIVLALRKGARPIDASKIQNWQPVPPEKALIFDSVVGEKVLLRIEEEDASEGEWESLFINKGNKRRHPYQQSREDDAHHRGRDNRNPGGYQGANNSDNPPNGRQQQHYHQNQHQQRNTGGDGGRYHNSYHDDGPRRGSSNYRGRGRGGGRGNRGGNQGRGGGRGRGRGGRDGGGGNPGGPSGYRSLDDYGSGGYDGANDDRGGGGNGGGVGPVMNY